MKAHGDTTIAAPATGAGGAIGIIRVSGPETFGIISTLFTPVSGIDILSAEGYTVHFGSIKKDDDFIDEVLVTLFRAPASYTGEDGAEISHHASPFIQRTIMEVLIEKGAKPAMAGEFTMRAFMNGRIDLSQAEAVADVIAADSAAAHRLAATQLRGGFSEGIVKLRQELISFASLIELELDFSEEDVQFADRFAMTETVIRVKDMVDSLASSFRLGNAIKQGIPVVIAGRPNVGKSSMLNVLLEEERAIVSDIPGTTRDTIEEVLHVGGLLFRFIDTAGLREGGDEIEELGMERTRLKLQAADIVLAVAEATDDAGSIAGMAAGISEITGENGAGIIVVINKSDLVSPQRVRELTRELSSLCSCPLLFVSARNGSGIEEIREQLTASVETGRLDNPQYIVTNARHYEALKNVSESLQRVLDGFRDGIPTVLIATDVRQAIYYLGQITGQITPDDILGEIFSKFCIG
ncbi:MAG: tRNA uridine-5-carboxymethylaminomethyl(34) synthesis GTPase MnmE, partial [Bacteroidales bacterium]|nr:tRNA uridine-5-carboxymethylaminomethyl(34) synthesis GTPase MnmE [Bacteroidales bacterium]